VRTSLHIDSTFFVNLRIVSLSEIKSMLLMTLAKLIKSLKTDKGSDVRFSLVLMLE